MHERWMLEVLFDIQGIVKQRNLTSLQPLIEAAFDAAKTEFKLDPPMKLQRSALHPPDPNRPG